MADKRRYPRAERARRYGWYAVAAALLLGLLNATAYQSLHWPSPLGDYIGRWFIDPVWFLAGMAFMWADDYYAGRRDEQEG